MFGKAVIPGLFMVLLLALSSSASVISVSLATQDWEKVAYYPSWQTYGTAAASVANMPDGDLRGTKTTATGGSNYFLGIHTLDAYDLQNGTLQFKWLATGLSYYGAVGYAAFWNGLDNDAGYVIYGQDPNPPYAGHLTTGWSFAGSEVLPSNTWLWTQMVFSETSYAFSISRVGYGGSDFLFGTNAIGPTTWAALAGAHPFFQIADNYTAGAFFEVAEVRIITPDVVPQPQPTVPEPSLLLLIALGLAGRAVVRRG